MTHVIELRSDTFTKPTSGMRAAIAAAEVGDDMVSEDPTVNALEARMADLLGKEAAVFACTATQANQMAVWTHCGSGDEVLIDETGHIANYEAGAPAALTGASVRRLRGNGGRLDVPTLHAALRPVNQHFAPTRLVCLENSTNLGGGRTYPLDQLQAIRAWAGEHGIPIHLDGARFFNACEARGYQPRQLADCVDTVTICFSKGLGCPMGAIFAGSHENVAPAQRTREIFGGALRQAGIPAAACLYALDHHVERLRDDHASARLFAERLSEIEGIILDLDAVETNLVFFELDPRHRSAAQLSTALRQRGVLINAVGASQQLRACTHLDVTRADVERAAELIAECLTAAPASPDRVSLSTY